MSKQPRDDANAPIPVLGLRPSGGQSVSISDTTARSAEINSHIRVVTLFSDTDCFIETGNSTVTASASTSHFLPASILFDISLGSDTSASDGDKFIAAITSSGTGTLRISERE